MCRSPGYVSHRGAGHGDGDAGRPQALKPALESGPLQRRQPQFRLAADLEVWRSSRRCWGHYARDFKASVLSRGFHNQFVGALRGDAAAYASSRNVQQTVVNAVNAPARSVGHVDRARARSAPAPPRSPSASARCSLAGSDPLLAVPFSDDAQRVV